MSKDPESPPKEEVVRISSSADGDDEHASKDNEKDHSVDPDEAKDTVTSEPHEETDLQPDPEPKQKRQKTKVYSTPHALLLKLPFSMSCLIWLMHYCIRATKLLTNRRLSRSPAPDGRNPPRYYPSTISFLPMSRRCLIPIVINLVHGIN